MTLPRLIRDVELISSLSSALGINPSQAEAVAGKVLGTVKDKVAASDPDAAAELGSAVPELDGWAEKAEAAAGGGAGGLLGSALGALGGEDAEDTAAIVSLLGKFNVDASKASLVAPIALKFLKSRLSEGTLDTILKAAPMLASLKGGGDDDKGGGLGGLLGKAGGLFG